MIVGGPDVVALGGGHGLAATLSAARLYAGGLTAVVSVADDGGSSGRLREMTGIPAPGDARRCLVALADPTSVWARAFEYRFGHGELGHGELGGHAFGNLVLAVLTEVSGDFGTALEHASHLLRSEGRVLPATTVPTELMATVGGRTLVGQVNVAACREPIGHLSVSPAGAPAPVEAVEAVRRADQVVLGPGSLYTSVLATAVVPDLTAAIGGRRGGRVFVANLRADEPEAAGYDAAAQLGVLAGHGVVVDVMVYDPHSASPAAGHLGSEVHGVRCVAADLTGPDGTAHDPGRLASTLASLV